MEIFKLNDDVPDNKGRWQQRGQGQQGYRGEQGRQGERERQEQRYQGRRECQEHRNQQWQQGQQERQYLTKKRKCDRMKEVAPDGAGDFDGEVLSITDLKQGVKNPNRVNVFVNEKFALSLDLTQVVEFKLKIGMELAPEKLAELQKASEFGKLYQRTLEWVLMRPRSEREAHDYLKRKIYEKKLDSSFSQLIIERLKAKNYLDDERFAKYYVENRFVKKGVSLKRLRMELQKKGVKNDLILQVLSESERDDEGEIKKMIAKKRGKYMRMNDAGKMEYDNEKLIVYLCRQGFSYDLVKQLVLDDEQAQS